MNVLALAAHYDDVELGCGGTLVKHVRRGDRVTAMVITHSGYRNPAGEVVRDADVAKAEGVAAARVMGVELLSGDAETNSLQYDDDLICAILRVVEGRHIDTMYTHWEGDAHQDHQAVAKASITAGKHVARILSYRSNQYESNRDFSGRFYVDITDAIEVKRQAILAHESELHRVEGRWLDVFTKQCEVDGFRAGVDFAERFEVVKYLATG